MKRPNNSGSVIRLSGKRRRPYAVRIFDGIEINDKGNGKPKYKYLGYFEKQKDALQYLEKFNGSPVTIAKPTVDDNKHRFKEIYNMYIKELKISKNLSPQSFQSRNAAYKQLSELHDMIFENITLEDLELVTSKCSGLSQSSIANQKILLKGMYKTAMRHKYVTEDTSALMITSYSNEQKRPHAPYTDEEIKLLWQHADQYFIRLILILIYTGMRINELLLMKSEDVHLDEQYMVGGLKTTAGKKRNIPISDKILPFLDTSNEYLITVNGKKISYTHAQELTFNALNSIGLKHTFHDTRHTCASLMERAGIEMLHRKLILGHKSSDITEHYTHVPISTLVNDINQI